MKMSTRITAAPTPAVQSKRQSMREQTSPGAGRALVLAIAGTLGALGTLGILVAPGDAYAADKRWFQVGGTLGLGVIVPRDYDLDDDRTGDARPSVGLFVAARLFEFPILSGWPFHAELGYQDFARTSLYYRTAFGTTRLTTSGNATYLAGRLNAPVTDGLSLYGKLGLSRNDVSSSTQPGLPLLDVDGSRTGLLAAFGVQYDFNFGVSVRAEAVSYGRASPGADAAAINGGISYRF